MKKIAKILATVLAMLTLASCGKMLNKERQVADVVVENNSIIMTSANAIAAEESTAEWNGNEHAAICVLDAYGRFGTKAISNTRTKAMVSYNGEKYATYDIENDGTIEWFPLSCGSGEYTISICAQIGGKLYNQIYDLTKNVNIAYENAPFLLSNSIVDYSSVELQSLTESVVETADTDEEKEKAIENYVASHIVYDIACADNRELTGCRSNPTDTINSGKGICIDYAILTAAMLRYAGVPTKIITGYANGIYHAWNSVCIDGKWKFLDTTFIASGLPEQDMSSITYVPETIY